MSDTPPEPDWNRLPRDPAGFFGLSGEFDRKDLKRAYNSLLRVYKPEKFPEEFQKIRAAFEQLDERLRYGTNSAVSELESGAGWHTDSAPPQREREVVRSGPAGGGGTQPASAPPEVSLIDRLATADPGALYQELKQKEAKSPFEYYALAVMSDVVEKSPTSFVEWLLRGITAHRRSGPLLNLLHAYLRSPQPTSALVKLLPAIARVLKDDSFFAITDPAWNKVLRECPFEQFSELLERCRKELRDAQITCQMVFLINILRVAMWHADREWTRNQLDYINANFEQIPPWLEGDVDLLTEIAGYLEVRRAFVAEHPLRQAIDKAMRDYFCENQQQGDRSVVNCHLQILADGEGLLAALALEENDTYSKFYPLWSWMSHDVAERHGQPQSEEINEQVWANRTQAMLERCVTTSQRSPLNHLWTLAEWAKVIVAIFVVIFVLGIASAILITTVDSIARSFSAKPDNAGVVAIVLVLAVSAGVSIPYWLWPKVIQKYWMPVRQRFARKCYEQLWRREVVAFQRRSHLPDNFFRALFHHFAPMNDHTQWINHFVQQDYAPAMVALAQRFEL